MTKTDTNIIEFIKNLRQRFAGEIFSDDLHLLMYATDASAYREKPQAVCYPRTHEDIRLLIQLATGHGLTLIPRTAGTSLAGQVVGNGIVVDVSKHWTKILAVDPERKTVTVQPGVILDELNMEMKKYGLFFGPETSTSSRCMIGGMIGNNSCGAHSLIYGSTRDHLLSVDVILADGTETTFRELTMTEFDAKCSLENTEGEIYRHIRDRLSDPQIQENIRREYPDLEIKRRNTGYAVDLLLETEPFTHGGPGFNMAKLIAGSEGTLAFITSATLNLVDVPPPVVQLICIHLNSVEESLKANLIALKHHPASVELMDGKILDLTKENPTQNKNRFFVQGNPGAILIVELTGNSEAETDSRAGIIIQEMQSAGLGYHFPVVKGVDMKKVWDLRKAGLGVLSNMPGDAKPVPVIEDTAVSPAKLPEYIREFNQLLEKLGLECVYYAHIGTGELHLRPVLNLKDPGDVDLFRTVALETALLVKKYGGSLSGEHGDGRLRGEFIPLMIGEDNFRLISELKSVWDPQGIFNRRKIIDTPPMNTSLRYEPGKKVKEIETFFDFSADGGFLRSVEKCNGSGDCRRTHLSGGTMCPSYMGTLDEQHTTRARANILREFLTTSTLKNPLNHKEIHDVLDLCLSCKACKSECPSNVDITKYKTEFLQHWYDAHHVPMRSRIISGINRLNRMGMIAPGFYNALMGSSFFSGIIKRAIGFSTKRKMPRLPKQTLRKQARKYLKNHNPDPEQARGKVVLFIDEFSNYQDAHVGLAVIMVLTRLHYHIHIVNHDVSGRTYLSKGLLRKAKKIVTNNLQFLGEVVNENCPLVGIEPSAILGFRDEYLSLCERELLTTAHKLSANAFLFEEFMMREVAAGRISHHDFNSKFAKVRMHGHCHQKALADTSVLKGLLELPENFCVTEIKSGCCGMAGAFGYEKEHYDVSMKIGELILFPAVRETGSEELIVAPGTSCREQIKDGTGRHVLHPAEALLLAID
jgi:FAD/FMN-containing dehydrogenase/Fe-S oxidoreductase